MNSKERTKKTIAHLETDIVPYSILFTPDEHKKMAKFYSDDNFESKIGNHIEYIDVRPPKTEIRKGFLKDDFGVVLNQTKSKEIGIVEECLVNSENFDSFVFPDTKDPQRYVKCKSTVAEKGDKFISAKFAHGLFERGWMLYGMEDLMSDMLLNPGVVNKLFDRLTEFFLDLLDEISKYDGIDCVHYGDDWGQQYGLLMGPALWRRFIKPRMKIIYQRAKDMGKYVHIHTCGDIQEIIPDLIEMGVDIYDPFQPETFDIFELKREYGKYITFLGGISLQRTLPFGTADEVREETLYKMNKLSKGGGYIIAPSHAITRDVPAENVDAMLKVLMNQ